MGFFKRDSESSFDFDDFIESRRDKKDTKRQLKLFHPLIRDLERNQKVYETDVGKNVVCITYGEDFHQSFTQIDKSFNGNIEITYMIKTQLVESEADKIWSDVFNRSTEKYKVKFDYSANDKVWLRIEASYPPSEAERIYQLAEEQKEYLDRVKNELGL